MSIYLKSASIWNKHTLYNNNSNRKLFYLCDWKNNTVRSFFVMGKKKWQFREFTDFYNTDCWSGVRRRSGWRRKFWWRNVLELLVDRRLTRAIPLLLQRLRTHSSSDMKKTGFSRGLLLLTLVTMLERYFSLEHSSIASSKRAEFGFGEVFKVSISAETVWIRSSWKTKQSCT